MNLFRSLLVLRDIHLFLDLEKKYLPQNEIRNHKNLHFLAGEMNPPLLVYVTLNSELAILF